MEVEDAKHLLQSDKLLGDKIGEVVKEWDAQNEGFYQRTGLSRGDQLMVIDNDESGVQNHEDDDFDELHQLLALRDTVDLSRARGTRQRSKNTRQTFC